MTARDILKDMLRSNTKIMDYFIWKVIGIRFRLHGHYDAWQIVTHLTKQERLLLYKLGISCLPGATFLEVGSYLGASACFLAAVASELGQGATFHSVDTWRNDAMTEGLRDTWPEFLSNVKRYRHVIVPHRGESVEVTHSFTKKLDLLFIDGDHSYEGCRTDVKSWLSQVKPRGFNIMHDSGWAAGVISVIRDFVSPLAESEEWRPNRYVARLP